MIAAALHNPLTNLKRELHEHASEYPSVQRRQLARRIGALMRLVCTPPRPKPAKPEQFAMFAMWDVDLRGEAAPVLEPLPAPPAICRADKLGRPSRSPEDDRLAFQALELHAAGTPERALYRLVSRTGLAAAAEKLSQQPEIVLGWIRAGAVPASARPALLRTPSPKPYQGNRFAHGDPRRARVLALADERRPDGTRLLSDRDIAAKVGVSRQTVMRWTTTEPKPLGRPKRAEGGQG